MTEQVLLISRIALLALVYLVFLRVARAVAVEIRAEAGISAPTTKGRPGGTRRPNRVAAGVAAAPASASPTAPPKAARHHLEILAPRSAAGGKFVLVGETTIGRATGCGVSIDDSRVSKIHARVFADGGRWMIEDLGSTNGTSVSGERIDSPRVLRSGDIVQVGEVVMEFA